MDKTNYWQIFLAEYPEGKGADTLQAREAWREVFPDDKPKIIKGLRQWNLSADWKDRKYIPNADNFIRSEKWKIYPNDMKTPFDPKKQHALSQEELFSKRHITTEAAYTMYRRAQKIDSWTKETGYRF